MTPVRAYISDRKERAALMGLIERDACSDYPEVEWRTICSLTGEEATLEAERILGETQPYRHVPVRCELIKYMPEGTDASIALTETITAILPELDRLAASR